MQAMSDVAIAAKGLKRDVVDLLLDLGNANDLIGEDKFDDENVFERSPALTAGPTKSSDAQRPLPPHAGALADAPYRLTSTPAARAAPPLEEVDSAPEEACCP